MQSTTELIPLLRHEGKLSVSARELYRFLELRPGDFARWAESNILSTPFASEGADWVATPHHAETPTGGKIEWVDYALTINFAKELAMMARSPRGKQARDYFLACEERARGPNLSLPAAPQTYPEALRALADSVEEKERLALAVATLEPKAEFYDTVIDSKTAMEMAVASDMLDFEAFGRTNLFAYLREKKILRQGNTPYREYCERGYFRVVPVPWTTRKGEVRTTPKTLVHQKGLDFIRRLLLADGYQPRPTPKQPAAKQQQPA